MINLNNILLQNPKRNEFVSYALEGEDGIINRFFKEKRSGFYVDIGAHHPFRFSNTYAFYKKGWRGINIDADKRSINLLNKYRNKDINILAAIGDNYGNKVFYQFDDPALNTFDKGLVKEYIDAGYKLKHKTELPFFKLKTILDEYNKDIKKIDFMSIDVEGFEEQVLRSNDWNKYRPELLIAEALRTDTLEKAIKCNTSKYLKSKNYTVIAKTLTDIFYKDSLL